MKKCIYVILSMVLYCPAFAQDKQAILHVLETQQQDWNRGSIDAFMQSYWKSDSLLFVGKTGPNYGWKTTLDNYKKHYPDKATMGHLDFKVIKLNLLGASDAFMLGSWHLTRQKNDVGGYSTLWFRKFKNGWKIVADHTS